MAAIRPLVKIPLTDLGRDLVGRYLRSLLLELENKGTFAQPL